MIENLAEDGYETTIREEGIIYTACGDAKISFVSAADVAAVAFRALTDEKSHNTDHVIVGPELLTYDDVGLLLKMLLSLMLSFALAD